MKNMPNTIAAASHEKNTKLSGKHPTMFYHQPEPLSSQQAAEYVYHQAVDSSGEKRLKHRPISQLNECFCGNFPGLVGHKTPMYVVPTLKGDNRIRNGILSNALPSPDFLNFLQRPSVVFKICQNEEEGCRVSFSRVDKDGHMGFAYVNRSIEQKLFELLSTEINKGRLEINDCEKQEIVKIMKKFHLIFQAGEHMVFDRNVQINARSMLDHSIVSKLTQRVKPGDTARIFSYASGNLGQEAIIAIMLLSRGIHVHLDCLDTMYKASGEDGKAKAVLLQSFYETIKKFQQKNLSKNNCKVNLYGELDRKSLPFEPHLVMLCDNDSPYFNHKGEELSWGGKAIRDDLETLLASGDRQDNCDDVQILMALKNSAGNEVRGFLDTRWGDIKSIENYEDLQSHMITFSDFHEKCCQGGFKTGELDDSTQCKMDF